jgi:uncharacterized membrane protein
MYPETSECSTVTENSRLERMLSGLLGYGAWLASVVIGAGLVLASANAKGMRVANAGIGLLILLPVSRLLLMAIVFLRNRDYRLALAAILVLSIILAGIVVGIRITGALGS